jgi:hypothetical protein
MKVVIRIKSCPFSPVPSFFTPKQSRKLKLQKKPEDYECLREQRPCVSKIHKAHSHVQKER